jgi:hypothetical protein
MDNTLLLILTIFVALTTIAMVVQAAAMLGIARAVKLGQEKLNALMPEVVKIVEATKVAVDQTGKLVTDANSRTSDILDATKVQLVKVDELLTDVTARAKVQIERAELVLDDAMSRTQQTVHVVQRGVINPIREVHGVLTGIRTALTHIGRSSRSTVDHATADEEMFI